MAAAAFSPAPSASVVNSSTPAAMISPHWIAPSTSAAMKREPTPASVSVNSTPSGVEIVSRSSYST